LALSIER